MSFNMGYAVEKLEGRGFDSRWGSLGFFIDLFLSASLCSWDRLGL
jgi:hypothetical protein